MGPLGRGRRRAVRRQGEDFRVPGECSHGGHGALPLEYIHIGGDECPKTRWEKCPVCQAKIRELGIKGDEKHAAEYYLQSYVTARVEKFLNEHGRRIIGWDEILEGELAPDATVMSWRGSEGGIAAAKLGHDAIMTPHDALLLRLLPVPRR